MADSHGGGSCRPPRSRVRLPTRRRDHESSLGVDGRRSVADEAFDQLIWTWREPVTSQGPPSGRTSWLCVDIERAARHGHRRTASSPTPPLGEDRMRSKAWRIFQMGCVAFRDRNVTLVLTARLFIFHSLHLEQRLVFSDCRGFIPACFYLQTEKSACV